MKVIIQNTEGKLRQNYTDSVLKTILSIALKKKKEHIFYFKRTSKK